MSHTPRELTRNQHLVYQRLGDAGTAMGAYELLDALRDQGLKAPAQVYRALDKLVALGLVHRLESVNGYIACRCRHGTPTARAAFAICERCGNVQEFALPADHDSPGGSLRDWAAGAGFEVRQAIVELRGHCRDCRRAPATPSS